MDKNVEITVIIPSYNSVETLPRTLASLERQVFKNFEVIVVNDGSTDGTDRWLINYISNSPLNITVINQENQGVSAARNMGLSKSQGRYIAFLDADDQFLENGLELLRDGLVQHQVPISYGEFTRKKDLTTKKPAGILTQAEMVKDNLIREKKLAFSCYLFEKKILDQYEINFDTRYTYGEDNLFLWKYLAHCPRGYYTGQTVYLYSDNPRSVMNDVRWEMIDGVKAAECSREYMSEFAPQYVKLFDDYLIPRTIWSVGKNYAQAGNRQLFNKWQDFYDVKKAMRKLVANSNGLLQLSARIYLLHPNLYYILIRLSSRIM